MSEIRVGTRASLLALTQTRLFTKQFTEHYPNLSVSEVHIQTHGDVSTEPLSASKTPGMFVSALRESLLDGRVDVIIHSMKDLPAAPHDGIVTACVPQREDVRDALISRDGSTLMHLAPRAIVGTSSPRRAASIRRVRPDLEVTSIRGNVDTRLRKVTQGEYDATLLAVAGLNRIGRADAITEVLSNELFVPAAGQGALSVECRTEDLGLHEKLCALDDPLTRLTTTAERAVLLGLDAGCATAIGAFASYDGNELTLTAELAVEETGEASGISQRIRAHLTDYARASALGLSLAEQLRTDPIAAKAAWK